MKKNHIFVTGISTEVGKTIASAILVQALEADYWKPIQSGDLHNTDMMKVKSLVTNSFSKYLPSAYEFEYPASPHLSAAMEGKKIDLKKIIRPETPNPNLVIEGAGGLFVPLNDTQSILDIILPEDRVILVSRHYLGSINHTMLSLQALQAKCIENVGLIFSGDENTSTESWILKNSSATMIGRINQEETFNKALIARYASEFQEKLTDFLS